MDPTIKCLRDLVAIDSVNPLLAPGGAGELAIAQAVADELRGIGLAVELEEQFGRRTWFRALQYGQRNSIPLRDEF